ncbi:MAG: MarR family transcriptional regulator [Lachnospiraceae bacterium]|nr:MarR family transcriptional regulator [Lachnospiraceae bacterium]MDE6185255.1 MarR family transcriptional regulator [Lachnospiraceae bacterium]
MSEKNICPGCGRHCDLSEPHCGRGEEYRRTGKMPEQQRKKHDLKMRMAHYHAADINDKLIINLRDLNHMMRLLYEGKASQRRILIILNESETITQRDLTERLGIKPGSASEILSKLESAGLIIRTQNETDRRTTDVCLTDSGRKLAQEALEQRQKRHEEMFSCLSGEERQELLSLLESVCADWRTRYRENGKVHEHGHRDGHGYHDGHRHHDGSHGHGGN